MHLSNAPLPTERLALLECICAHVDPRIALTVSEVLARPRRPLPLDRKVVLVGHRCAGKTTLLPLVARWLHRTAHDLDTEIAARTGRTAREWIERNANEFRRMEREVFTLLPARTVIAAGGGFLSLHADLLRDALPVLVPVTFETYRERILMDTSRPRLYPELPLEEEITRVFTDREQAHARVPTVALADFLAATMEAPL